MGWMEPGGHGERCGGRALGLWGTNGDTGADDGRRMKRESSERFMTSVASLLKVDLERPRMKVDNRYLATSHGRCSHFLWGVTPPLTLKRATRCKCIGVLR
ncbi:hypothetical protein NQZ68_007116 [Dissostichus eleginoides]|nr:hypothetical protein NQZ68_007116 [Dissostichus eleginoides]